MNEVWLPVVGYEGLYEVSDQGRVRSIARIKRYRTYGGRILKPALNRNYLCVGLCRDGTSTTRSVHSIVAEAFLGPKADGTVVRHGPNGNLDNTPSNLSYGTQADNINDKRRDGTWQIADTAGRRVLTSKQVVEIYQSTCSSPELAAAYGVDQSTIRAIWRGKNWRSITNHLPERAGRG